ncbi:MAG: coproporphyrinogen III oxidase family protein [Bacteroidales bacterium]|nr:coproporphyrinogen III oxidase family protein [Bacteroidales bacterium]
MIYLHVPFCESRCTYCGFYSNVISNVILSEAKNLCYEAYADAVCAEVAARREEIARTLEVNTLYIGGGTPSVLPLDVLSRIVNAIKGNSLSPEGAMPPNPPRFALRPVSPAASHPFMWPRAATGSAGIPLPASNDKTVILSEAKNLFPWSEFTVEVNPEDIVRKGEEYVKGLLALGVNRISMGVQSFDDGILWWMNRRHDSAAAVEAFRILRHCGVGNISIDLIFGLPQLSESVWTDTLEKALDLGPEHISAYQLSIEEGSALEKLIAKGGFAEATEDQCREQYDQLCARLGEAGYHHYEVSNFSRPGYEAVHNSAYWRRVPYVGLGPGAHSLSAGSVRSWNSRDLPRRLQDGSLKTYSKEEELLTTEDIRVERIMLPLRTDMGLQETELRSLAGDYSVDLLLASGALVRCHPERVPEPVEGRSEGFLRIPEDHFFVSDDIISDLI